MGQTANYQLNLWDKTDRIQMEDFNADNAKIDAALTASPYLRRLFHGAEIFHGCIFADSKIK